MYSNVYKVPDIESFHFSEVQVLHPAPPSQLLQSEGPQNLLLFGIRLAILVQRPRNRER